MINLEIQDKYELLALHRAMMEAKFHSDPKDVLVQQSPMVASVMNQIVDKMEEINWVTKAEKKYRGTDWKNEWAEWRQAPSEEIVLPCLIRNLDILEKFASESNEKFNEYLETLFAPYKVSNSRMIELVEVAKNRKI